MSPNANTQQLLALESRILRALCAHESASRATILAKLSDHRWQDPEHRVVFEALTLLPQRQPEELRAQLPAQTTRMGFPDVNWEAYFAPETHTTSPEAVLKELLTITQEENP